MKHNRGFATVATGSEYYYQLAANLYLSYKKRAEGKYPFALICDRENAFSALFDHVVVVDHFRRSTVDKLLMWNSPYEETVFLDADTLILDDINDLWDIFENQDDVSAFGCTLPLDSQKGWFTYEGSGRYKSQVKYLVSMNGGIYYFRKTPRAERVIQNAIEVIEDYSTIDFKYFSTPQDEPLMAMAMVINECAPCDVAYDMIILPAHRKKVSVDFTGKVYEDRQPSKARMIHFSTARTRLFLYNYLLGTIRNDGEAPKRRNYWRTRLRYAPKDLKAKLLHSGGAVMRKMGLDTVVEFLKKRLR